MDGDFFHALSIIADWPVKLKGLVYGIRRTVTAREDSSRNKISNHKFQITNKFQTPNSNDPNESPFGFFFFVLVIGSLVLGAYLEFGAWDLVLEFSKPYIVCHKPYADRRGFELISSNP